ncbi:unnamed protein product [Arctia plantaginis]|uniref:Uncharacterized protein n=1 Tax=Arctia plantaginis TaxID=874455 RepID=A0A8S0ZVN0_ARCPL|nr:unnamed protein product [Arctia plantaginis]
MTKKIQKQVVENLVSPNLQKEVNAEKQELRAKVSTEALLYSATSKLRSEGNIDFANVVRDISEGSPTKAARYRKSLESTNNNVPFTENEALSLYVELGLSQSKYQLLRNAHMEKKSRMFPAYKKIQKAKLQCYPATDPYISSCRKLPAKPMKSLSADTIDLLLSPSIDAEEVLESTDCSSASETETDVDADDLADNEIFFM